MTQQIEIIENSSISLGNDQLEFVQNILQQDKSLPLFLNGSVLSFASYTVGEFKFGDFCISIKPRNPAITLRSIFEMQAFVDNTGFNSNVLIAAYGTDKNFGLNAVVDNFIQAVSKLVSYGLAGSIIRERAFTQNHFDEIDMSLFRMQLIPIHGVAAINQNFNVDTQQNRLIKLALTKLLRVQDDQEMISKTYFLLRDFDSVAEINFDDYNIDEIVKQNSTANPFYPYALEYAAILLKNLKFNFTRNNKEWYSFLCNSNSIFERFCLTSLKQGLKEHVSKWNSPKIFASLAYLNKQGHKSYIPDIMIKHSSEDKTIAILDAKNKAFNPENSNPSELVSSADIYQLIFYCEKLDVNTCALVYPSLGGYKPIRVSMNDKKNLNFYLISVDMQIDLNERVKKLVEDTVYILNLS